MAGPLLADMGLLDSFLAEGHGRWQVKRSVWERPEPVEADLLRDPDGLGWQLDRRRFGAWLRQVAVARGAAVLVPATVDAISREGGGWRVDLETASGPAPVRARVVIDAGGRSAPLAARLGARRRRTDRLVCGWVEGHDRRPGRPGRHGSPGTTYLEAVPGGWWYTAGLPDGRRLVAFHTDNDLDEAAIARHGLGLGAAARAVGGLSSVLDDAGFEAGAACGFSAAHSAALDPCAGPGWVAAGDAALSFDPVSSQGLLNALVTGLAAAEGANRHLAGAAEPFAEYQSMVARAWRQYQDELGLLPRRHQVAVLALLGPPGHPPMTDPGPPRSRRRRHIQCPNRTKTKPRTRLPVSRLQCRVLEAGRTSMFPTARRPCRGETT